MRPARRYASPVLFNAIFLTLFLLTWGLEALLPWLVLGFRRRGEGALWALPFGLLGGAGGGALAPLLGLTDGSGIALSLITAPLGGMALAGAAFRAWDAYAIGRWLQRRAVQPLPGIPAVAAGAAAVTTAAAPSEQEAASVGSQAPPMAAADFAEAADPPPTPSAER